MEKKQLSESEKNSDVATARNMCAGYTASTYATMRDDEGRVSAYARAIKACAKGKVVLDLGTGALALLAIMAAREGATRVYAIEVNEEACQKAKETVAEAGLSDVITVLQGFSTEVELPERVDLIVHEIIGEIATLEGVVVALRDALRRFGKPGGCQSIPDRVQSFVAPAMMPDAEYWSGRTPCIVDPRSTSFKVWDFPERLRLAEPACFECIPFNSGIAGIPVSEKREFRLTAVKEGIMEGLVIHIELEVGPPGEKDGEVAATTVSSRCGASSHWANVFVILGGQEILILTSTLIGRISS